MKYETHRDYVNLTPHNINDLRAINAAISQNELITILDFREPPILQDKKVKKIPLWLTIRVVRKQFIDDRLLLAGHTQYGSQYHHYYLKPGQIVRRQRALSNAERLYLDVFCRQTTFIWCIFFTSDSWVLAKLYDTTLEVIKEEDVFTPLGKHKKSLVHVVLPDIKAIVATKGINKLLVITAPIFVNALAEGLKSSVKSLYRYETWISDLQFIRDHAFYKSTLLNELLKFRRVNQLERLSEQIVSRTHALHPFSCLQTYRDARLLNGVYITLSDYTANVPTWEKLTKDVKLEIIPASLLQRLQLKSPIISTKTNVFCHYEHIRSE